MPAENFKIAGLTNPAITVPAGAYVTIELINADADMAHGLVITASNGTSTRMPMMTGARFPGSALWFVGQPTAAGMHTGTLILTASAPGSYRYLCPVPGHAEEGMAACSPSPAAPDRVTRGQNPPGLAATATPGAARHQTWPEEPGRMTAAPARQPERAGQPTRCFDFGRPDGSFRHPPGWSPAGQTSCQAR